MTNPTSNYGWQMPTSTDLVTDLPADFEVFGQSADSTVFANAALAVNKTIVDAKGDLIAATAADTVSRLAVGANDTVLTADSTAATGMKWAAAGGGAAFSGAQVRQTAAVSINNSSWTTLAWNAEDYDVSSYHDNSTNNSRLTVPTTGYYFVTARTCWAATSTAGIRGLVVVKNGGAVGTSIAFNNDGGNKGTSYNVLVLNTIIQLNATDYIEALAFQNSGGSLDMNGDNINPGVTAFLIYFIGA